MITISLCMIVKNEAVTLKRCLDSLEGLMDEIIIIDTGSTDDTKSIATKYTDKIFDYKWINDFSAARNFAFSKATMDYIYTADADEILDTVNYKRFLDLKKCMSPDVEIVQMKYINDSADNNVQNSRMEYRPKLMKRLRNFIWIDPIHETLRLDPLVFDSDIEILHCPVGVHTSRDFSIFERQIRRGYMLSPRIQNMYARELLIAGNEDDFKQAIPYFYDVYENAASSNEARKEAGCVLSRAYRLIDNPNEFFKYALKDMITTPCSEICYELGEYYYNANDYIEAALWFYNAVYETSAILNIHCAGDFSLDRLASCYEILSKKDGKYKETATQYRMAANEWKLPNEL